MGADSRTLFHCEQDRETYGRYAALMDLQRLKMMMAASWVTVTLAVAIVGQVAWPFQLPLAALGLLPPLALLLWWNEPVQTMTEAIDEVRRTR